MTNMDIDKIFQKVKYDKIKKISYQILYYMFMQTDNYNEIKFIIQKLKNLGANVDNYKTYSVELLFAEDYKSAKEIFHKIKAYKERQNLQKSISSINYSRLMETTDTSEEAEEVFLDIKNNNVDRGLALYIALMEKQKNYKNARKIFNDFVFPSEYEIIKRCKETGSPDGVEEAYAIMYVKAKSDEEIEEIKNELVELKMSTDICCYDYLKVKSSIRRVKQIRSENWGKAMDEALNSFFEKNEKPFENNINFGARKRNIVVSGYERNTGLVKEIKRLYNDTCQICGKRLDLGDRFYSEVHHVRPLYLNGPDISENMIVLCPNHHVLFDKGAISVDLDLGKVRYLNGVEENINIKNHNIAKEYMDFHNKNIFNKGKDIKFENDMESDRITFGSNVILINDETKEEMRIVIEKNKIDLTYLEFKLLDKKKGNSIVINDTNYVTRNII